MKTILVGLLLMLVGFTGAKAQDSLTRASCFIVASALSQQLNIASPRADIQTDHEQGVTMFSFDSLRNMSIEHFTYRVDQYFNKSQAVIRERSWTTSHNFAASRFRVVSNNRYCGVIYNPERSRIAVLTVP